LGLGLSGCASSIPQRDLNPDAAKARGYFLSADEAKGRGGIGAYAPMVCTDGGWGFPAKNCDAMTSARTVVKSEITTTQAAPLMNNTQSALAAKYDEKKTVRFYFDTAKSELTADDEVKLNALKASKIFIVRGFTDARGNTALNQKLSQQRAARVARILKAKGFNTQNANIAGMGEIKNATQGTAADEARRVEVIFQ
jgi:outer membrane protein OmpA-like peptidoglycan-associated protein